MTESLLLAFAKKQIRVNKFGGFPQQEQYPDGFHRLPAFVAAFPAVTTFQYPCSAYTGWLQDLLKLKKYDLKAFYISSNSFEKLFSFRPKEMLKFIKRQSKHNEDFCLYMDYSVNDITPIELERIHSLFEPYFEQQDSLTDCHLSMCIFNVSGNTSDWYRFKQRSVSDYAFAYLACAFNFQQRHAGCAVSI
uniref:DUF72 domain-containing protein n=1 Tax=Panagrellus redivivus TaxID=6233 RepID=A0A7E4VAD7_PANRE